MDADFAAIVVEQLRRNHEVLERMCERMLVLPGDRGVLVTLLPMGTVRAELSDDVPFGEIHYTHHGDEVMDAES